MAQALRFQKPGVAIRPEKKRLDVLLVERGLAESRNKAQALILAGRVAAPGAAALKAGSMVYSDQVLQLSEAPPYVSRGGEKLAPALARFAIDVQGRRCWDVGASTGGFTDCLLQKGASQVVAIDVGRGQLHWKLQKDPRVLGFEKTHILEVEPGRFPDPSLVTVDVSFISLGKVFPHLARLLPAGTGVVALVKPQFEAGPKGAPKGVVRDPALRDGAIEKIRSGLPGWGFELKGEAGSALKGPKGNQEHFIYAVRV